MSSVPSLEEASKILGNMDSSIENIAGYVRLNEKLEQVCLAVAGLLGVAVLGILASSFFEPKIPCDVEKNQYSDVEWLLIKDDLEGLQRLVSKKPAAIDERGKHGFPIYFAGAKKAHRCLEFILDRKFDSNPSSRVNELHQQKLYSGTVLHFAVVARDRVLVKAVLRRGALLGKKDHWGRTPMHIAVLNKDFDMVRLLWRVFARLDVPDQEGKTPFDRAKKRSPYEKLYPSFFDRVKALQQQDSEDEPWVEGDWTQRDEKGKIITDKSNQPKKFEYVVDSQTSDVYEKVGSVWQLRRKALITSLTTPFYLPMSIAKQLAGFVLDLGKISVEVAKTVSQQIKSKQFLACLSAVTITPIKDVVRAVAVRIWSIVSAPFYMIGMLFAAIYTQYDQLNGRKMMNKMAEGWNEMGFLRFMGLAKVGNVCESERCGVAQFVIDV